MKETERESTELKAKFKAHFSRFGYDAPLSGDLEREVKAFPIEWAEACQEWEAEAA
jgi:hypothetical protein